eukprot:366195-Chlamydomonas_euryale.AAC.9
MRLGERVHTKEGGICARELGRVHTKVLRGVHTLNSASRSVEAAKADRSRPLCLASSEICADTQAQPQPQVLLPHSVRCLKLWRTLRLLPCCLLTVLLPQLHCSLSDPAAPQPYFCPNCTAPFLILLPFHSADPAAFPQCNAA